MQSETLFAALAKAPPSLSALSGGVDSSLLALLLGQASRISGARHVLAHAVGPHVPPGETGRARDVAAMAGLELLEIPFSPLDVSGLHDAGRMRCYHCKKALFSRLCRVAKERGLQTVMDGSNASDLEGWRPGLKALAELGVASPLMEHGLHKKQVRAMARELGLPWWDTPARPCLLTRFGYDIAPQQGELELLAAAEARLAEMAPGDFRLRVPARGALLLQVEAALEHVWRNRLPEIHGLLTELGVQGDVALQGDAAISGWYDHPKNGAKE